MGVTKKKKKLFRINKIYLQITLTLNVKIILSTRKLIGQDFDVSNFLIQIQY